MIEEQKDKIQPIHAFNDGLINSYTGKLINYQHPTAEMITLEDIAKGLSNICRFGGQIRFHYSVAEHTLLVWLLAPAHLKRAALLHDAAEAYVGDVVKPLKVLLGEVYAQYERAFEAVIFSKYGVALSDLEELKQYDMQALEIENNYFRFGNDELIRKMVDICEMLPVLEITPDTNFYRLLIALKAEFEPAVDLEYLQDRVNERMGRVA